MSAQLRARKTAAAKALQLDGAGGHTVHDLPPYRTARTAVARSPLHTGPIRCYGNVVATLLEEGV